MTLGAGTGLSATRSGRRAGIAVRVAGAALLGLAGAAVLAGGRRLPNRPDRP